MALPGVPIPKTQCIGDSLQTINNALTSLDVLVATAVASVTTGSSAPTSPSEGDIWFDEDSGSLYVYYNDGTSSQWVDTSSGGGGGGAAGSGTANYIPKWSDSNTLADSNVIAGTGTTDYALKVNVPGSNTETLFQIASGGWTCNTTDLFPYPTNNAGYTGNTAVADYHYMSKGFTKLAITSLDDTLVGDAVLTLRNAPADNSSSTAHQWAIHNDRSGQNGLDFRYDNDTKFSILTSGEVSLGGVQASDLVTVDSVTTPTQVASTSTDFTNIKNGARKVKGSSILSNWYRFSHHSSSWTQPFSANELSTWDIKNNNIVNETNSSTTLGFVSDSIYDNYIAEINISSTANDDDQAGFVIAFYKDPTNGREYTLSLYRSPGNSQAASGQPYVDSGPGITWALMYGYSTPDSATLVDNSSTVTNYHVVQNSATWTNFPGGCKLRIVRRGDIIEAWTSNFATGAAPTTVVAGTKITWDLNSDSRTRKFIGKRPFGYWVTSQAYTTWNPEIFVNTSPICNLADGNVYKFNTSGWNSATIGANASRWIVDTSTSVDKILAKSAFLYDQYIGSSFKLIDGSQYEFKWPKNAVDVDDLGAVINVNDNVNLEVLKAIRIRGSLVNNDVYTDPGSVALKGSSATSDPFISFHKPDGTRLGYFQNGDDRMILANQSNLNTSGIRIRCRVGSTDTDVMSVQADGDVYFPSLRTGSGTPIEMSSTFELLRDTSSARYKIDIENAESAYSENLILNSRPVWYRSNPLTTVEKVSSHSYWGFIAEEIAELDPRMVSYEYLDEDLEIIDGEKVPKPGAKLVPASVKYDRFSAHLVSFAQKQHQEIQTMKSQIESLEARLAALEAK